jgi:hypothetical protein
MELALNLAWVVLTTLMLWLWVRSGPCKGTSRPMQIAALATVILILLPAISVTDDLMMAQNPAETDRCQRKDQLSATAHATLHPVANLTLPFFAGLSFDSSDLAAPGNLLIPTVKVPAMDSIQNRPPPAARPFLASAKSAG